VLDARSPDPIGDFQRREGVDLLVAATHGYSGVKHFLLGSFAAKLIQLSTCPVLLFRSVEGRPAAEFAPRRILAPYDFSSLSKHGIEVARSWARAFEARVRLLHVVEEPMEAEELLPLGGGTAGEYFRHAM